GLYVSYCYYIVFFSSRRRHTRCYRDWSSDVRSSDLGCGGGAGRALALAQLALHVVERGVADVLAVHHVDDVLADVLGVIADALEDRKSTRLNSSHGSISYAVFCLKKKKKKHTYINSN